MSATYLHIGITKTGTTAIQKYLANNRTVLIRNGYLYPSCFCITDDQHLKLTMMAMDTQRTHIVRELNNITSHESIIDLRLSTSKEAKSEFESYNCDNIILSDEGLAGLMSNDELHWLKTFLIDIYGKPITVILYLRRQDSHALSTFAQHILSGIFVEKPFELPGETEENLWDYLSIIKRYENTFGKGNIRVLIYEDAISTKGGLMHSFMEQVGLDYKTDENIRENLSLPLEALLFINHINYTLKKSGIEYSLIRRLASELRQSIPVYKGILKDTVTGNFSYHDRCNFLGQFNEINERIAKEYFPDKTSLFPAINKQPNHYGNLDIQKCKSDFYMEWLLKVLITHIENEDPYVKQRKL